MIEPLENRMLVRFDFQEVPFRSRTASRTGFALTLRKGMCVCIGTKNPWTPQLVGVRSSTVGINACACSSLNFSMARAAGMLPRKIRAKQMSWRMFTCVP
jgi:hypothetical protein